jgi:hypothetical protein
MITEDKLYRIYTSLSVLLLHSPATIRVDRWNRRCFPSVLISLKVAGSEAAEKVGRKDALKCTLKEM